MQFSATDLQIIQLFDHVHVFELFRFVGEAFQQRQLGLALLAVIHLQLVGQTLRFLAVDHFGVVFASHQDQTLAAQLRVQGNVQTFWSVLLVDLECIRINASTLIGKLAIARFGFV